jgi:hypothetical protein
MYRTVRQLSAVAFTATVLALCANAQATRTWVSGVGDDANPCSRTAPCKTLAGAISKTAAGGEISILDPAGVGALTITKSITINSDGNLGGVLVSGTPGITVAAGPTDVVILRGISFNGLLNNGTNSGTNGINFTSGALLVVENCSIYGFNQNGINVALSASGSLSVQDVSITGSNTSGGVVTGVKINSTAGTTIATLNRVSIKAATNGVDGE